MLFVFRKDLRQVHSLLAIDWVNKLCTPSELKRRQVNIINLCMCVYSAQLVTFRVWIEMIFQLGKEWKDDEVT